jgi:hypothetical protein
VGRNEEREEFEDHVRIRLVEGDIDRLEAALAAERTERKAAIATERTERTAADDKLGAADATNRQVLVGALVSLVVAAVMLAANLAVMR